MSVVPSLSLVGIQCYVKTEAEAERVPLWQLVVSALWWRDSHIGPQGVGLAHTAVLGAPMSWMALFPQGTDEA